MPLPAPQRRALATCACAALAAFLLLRRAVLRRLRWRAVRSPFEALIFLLEPPRWAYPLCRWLGVEPAKSMDDVAGLDGRMITAATIAQRDLEFPPPLCAMEPVARPLRTDDERFRDLPGYNFKANYVTSRSHGQLRIHYVDEGPRDAAETVLLLHGEPTWSYLYRHMIPPLAEKGYRVVAPDLVGFGKSDKPRRTGDYSYERHVDWLVDFIVEAKLGEGEGNITLFAQDWGGLIGLRVVARVPERFRRIAIGNTGLPADCDGGLVDGCAPFVFFVFRIWAGAVSQRVARWGDFVGAICNKQLSDAERRAYDAPFPTEEYKAGTRAFPRLVPQGDEWASVEENRGAWRRVLRRWRRPFLTLFSDRDAVTNGGDRAFRARVPGAAGQAHRTIHGASHFVQEDEPRQLVEHLDGFIRHNPAPAPPTPATDEPPPRTASSPSAAAVSPPEEELFKGTAIFHAMGTPSSTPFADVDFPSGTPGDTSPRRKKAGIPAVDATTA